MLYNNSVGKNTMSKCQRTDEFTRKLCSIIYYVPMNTYNIITCNCLRVLVKFHTKISFHASLSIRVSDSGHPVKCARQFLQPIPAKIYISGWQYAPHKIIDFYIILKFYIQRHFLRHPVTRPRYTAVWQNAQQDIIRFYIIIGFYIRSHFLRQPVTCARKYRPLQNTI